MTCSTRPHLIRFGRGFPAVVLAFMLPLAGCTSTRLAPAPEARQVSPEAAVDTVKGVKVTVAADTWSGPLEILPYVTPIEVTIHNGGSQPLAIRYEEFSLVGPDGTRYHALPPFLAEAVARDASLIDPIGFSHRGFYLAPPFHRYYRGLSVFDERWVYDPIYDRTYYDYWGRHSLALDELRRRAIPPGVLSPGGQITGFLYFEKVPADVGDKIAFSGDLVSSRTGEVFGTVRVPFQVEEVAS